MFGCQQVLIKFDSATMHIWEYLCLEANDLYNCTVYYARQIWFKAGKIVTGFDRLSCLWCDKFNSSVSPSLCVLCVFVVSSLDR
jgi:putative transposase